MRQVQLQRGYRHIAILDRFKIGGVTGGVLNPVQAEPEVTVSPWIGSFNHRSACIVMEALPHGAGSVERCIWGATAGMLRNFYRFLLAEEAKLENP